MVTLRNSKTSPFVLRLSKGGRPIATQSLRERKYLFRNFLSLWERVEVREILSFPGQVVFFL
jgi:hypothetical protein